MQELTRKQMRRHVLALQGPLAGPLELRACVDALGFVQVDSVNVLVRAHHHILAARLPAYRVPHLRRAVEKDRAFFENWTHDASILPIGLYPYWKHRFVREKARLRQRWRRQFDREDFDGELGRVIERIGADGPLRARDFGGDRPGTGWWDWHPSKAALEYLWRTGELAISGRDGFQKIYDLPERVIPEPLLREEVEREAFVDWACRSALARLGLATRGEIAAFWALLTPAEVDAWIALQGDALERAALVFPDGARPRAMVGLPGSVEAARAAAPPPARLRILSPFDPLLRDRGRLLLLFGFGYRIEIFVPEARRKFGYCVFPVLRGERFLGRVDMKADRAADTLRVAAFWPERGVRMSKALLDGLERETARLARLAGVAQVEWRDGWLREAV